MKIAVTGATALAKANNPMSRLTLTLVVFLAVALPADKLPSLHAAISYTARFLSPALWTSGIT